MKFRVNNPQALVDLDALAWNYRYLSEKSAPAETGAAVKANAYGLGLETVVRTLHQAGCRHFFTAHFEEALAVRRVIDDGVVAPLHGMCKTEFSEAVARNITPVINHLGALELWSGFVRERSLHYPAFVHLDTGLNRLGLARQEQLELAAHTERLDGVAVRGWLSHFACADEPDNPMSSEQGTRLKTILQKLPAAPVCFCNSSGIFLGKDYLFDLTRPGYALYGGNPTPHAPNPMRPVLTLQAPILQVRDVDSGMSVGYGASHRIARRGRVATLALGYADGYHRRLSGKGLARIGEYSAPIIGRVSMDLLTLDVTALPDEAVACGTMVELIGPHRTLDAVAAEADTIGYEILTSLGSRVERVYRGGA